MSYFLLRGFGESSEGVIAGLILETLCRIREAEAGEVDDDRTEDLPELRSTDDPDLSEPPPKLCPVCLILSDSSSLALCPRLALNPFRPGREPDAGLCEDCVTRCS